MGVLVGGKVAVGPMVGIKVLVGDGVAVTGKGVGVLLDTTVGKDCVGVASRVAVGEPTTRVEVGVGTAAGWVAPGII